MIIGNISRLLAKMIGMTPAWLTLSGRYWRVPPKTRRPRTCLALCIGMRRWPSVMNTTPVTTATNMAASTIRSSTPSLLPPPLSSSVACCSSSQPAAGMRARMPAMINRLMPLPMPNSSICSPSHIRNIGAGGHRQHGDDLPTARCISPAAFWKRGQHEALRLDVRLDVEPALEQTQETRWRSACIR